jgi:hypothetical protein
MNRPPRPPLPTAPVAANVARWARRFRRLAAVVTFENEPDRGLLDQLVEVRHGGLGVPRSALAKLPPAAKARFETKPFLVLDHPDESLARIARLAGPRAPAHLVEGAVHALSYCAPLVLTDKRDAQAFHPLAGHVVAIPGDAVNQVLASDFESALRGGSAATQDGYGQIERAGRAILDLAHERARERTLTGLLQRLTRARGAWAGRDAEKRFRRIVDAARTDAEGRGVAKGEKDPLVMAQPIALGYLDLLPLILTRLGGSSDLAREFEKPLAHLALGVGVVAAFA